MAESVVSICNQALQLIGEKAVTEVFPPDANKRARECNTAYVAVRDAVTREHTWNCSTARVSLPALAAAPLNGYSFQYQRSENPKDIKVWTVNEDPEDNFLTAKFQVEGRVILTDETAPIKVKFSKEMTDPAEMDALFENVLVHRMAARIAYAITASRQVAADMITLSNNEIKKAKAMNGQEGTGYNLWANDLRTVRFT